MKRPFLVLVFLLIASVACYSDSPLWPFGVTEVPPTTTFLPTPDQSLYPSRFSKDEIILAPQTASADQAFFFVTGAPEELASGVRNAAGSCDYGSSLEILYIGHLLDNYTGDAYLDNIALVTGDTSEVLFDFEANAAAWTLDEARPAGQSVAGQSGVDFNSQRAKPAEGQEAPDATNATTVLRVQGDYGGNNWESSTYTTFENGVDWSAYESLSVDIFVPEKAKNFRAILYVKVGAAGDELVLEPRFLTSGAWSTVTVTLSDFGDVSDVREFGIRFSPNPTDTYYLVVCTGAVGWANEDRLAGPVSYLRGQSAMTRSIGVRGEELPTDAGRPVFSIHEGTEPPLSPNFPATKACNVGEVVDILDISAVEDPLSLSDYLIWYQINCPISGVSGWVVESRLFGPLRLPAFDGIGIVMTDTLEPVNLTASAGPVSDTNLAVGSCPASATVRTLGFATLSTDETIQPYYQVDCLGTIGWTAQDPFIEIPYVLDTYTMVVGDEKRDTVEDEEAATEEEPTEVPTTEDGETTIVLLSQGAAENYLPVDIANVPQPAFEGNLAGTCASGAVVQLQAVSS